jgi:hypothetical protein
VTVFVRFTQAPEGAPIYVRQSRVLGFAASEDGTRIFLTGAFNCLVQEDHAEVLAALQAEDDARR